MLEKIVVTLAENKPFKNEFAARMYAGRRYATYTIIPHLDGFAIETDGVLKEKKIKQDDVPAKTFDSASLGAKVKKHRITTPWKPASLIEVPDKYKDPNFVYRFAKKDKAGNIQKKISEGWEIDTEVEERIKNECPELLCPTINDGKPLDRSFHIREMVLMKMPKETADSRNAYYEQRNSAAQNSAESLYKSQHKTSYGKVIIEQDN